MRPLRLALFCIAFHFRSMRGGYFLAERTPKCNAKHSLSVWGVDFWAQKKPRF